MKTGRGICVHRVQIVLATVMPIEPRGAPDLRITLLKYDQYYPRIVDDDDNDDDDDIKI